MPQQVYAPVFFGTQQAGASKEIDLPDGCSPEQPLDPSFTPSRRMTTCPSAVTGRRDLAISSLKGAVRSVIRACTSSAAQRNALIWQMMVRWHDRRNAGHPWLRTHPFDTAYGTDTSGYVPGQLLGSSRQEVKNNGYAGCQPSCLRSALKSIPDKSAYTFIDLGCGKGRSAMIASENPFKAITGIEISKHLCEIARRNFSTLADRHPGRTIPTVRNQSFDEFRVPEGNLAFFSYNSFGRDLLRSFIEGLKQPSAGQGRRIYFIYENPVHKDVFDGDAVFRPYHAEYVRCDADERAFQPDEGDTVMIWRAS